MLGIVPWLVDKVLAWWRGRRDVRVRVHLGVFVGSDVPHYFINILNASPQKTVTVTHVWLDATPPLAVSPKALPVKIEAEQQWETWVPISDLPADLRAASRAVHVALSDDTVLRATPRKNVPPVGPVPG